MSGNEALKPVREYMKTIENAKIYFTLRKMKIRRISNGAMRAVKIFLALREFEMTIVGTNLFLTLYETTLAAALAQLHRLGDKGVITLIKGGKFGQLRYMLSQKFLELWSKNIEQEDLNTS